MTHGVAFVHVPRTAGTSIRHALRLGTGSLHRTARDLHREVGAAAWGDTFSFAFVRNPWRRALSLYCHLERDGASREGFRAWVVEGLPAPERDGICVSAPMVRWIRSDGDVLVNHVGRFERLEEEWRGLRERIIVDWPYPVPEELSRVNSSARGKVGGWYDAATALRIGRYYREDVAAFDYACPVDVLSGVV